MPYALDCSRELGWAVGEAVALGIRGFGEWSMALLEGSREDFTTGLRITHDIGNRHVEAFGLVGFGMACWDLGRLHEAAAHLELAIIRGAELGWWDDSLSLQVLGRVYWELGRFADGLDVLAPAVTLDKRAGYRDGRAMMLDAIAKIHLVLGHHDAGLEQAEQALALVKDVGREWIRAGILNTVAAAHRRLAHPDRALPIDEQALALARGARSKRAETDSLLSLSLTLKEMGRYDETRSPR